MRWYCSSLTALSRFFCPVIVSVLFSTRRSMSSRDDVRQLRLQHQRVVVGLVDVHGRHPRAARRQVVVVAAAQVAEHAVHAVLKRGHLTKRIKANNVHDVAPSDSRLQAPASGLADSVRTLQSGASEPSCYFVSANSASTTSPSAAGLPARHRPAARLARRWPAAPCRALRPWRGSPAAARRWPAVIAAASSPFMRLAHLRDRRLDASRSRRRAPSRGSRSASSRPTRPASRPGCARR